jgi:hypothetical protein
LEVIGAEDRRCALEEYRCDDVAIGLGQRPYDPERKSCEVEPDDSADCQTCQRSEEESHQGRSNEAQGKNQQ